MNARMRGQVRVVGAGLLGSSVGLGLRELGVDVILADHSPGALALAVDYGAGRGESPSDAPELIVVAVPPDVVARVVDVELRRFPGALVTDVASVKSGILGDRVYGIPGGPMLLHASRLVVPREPKPVIDVTAPLPEAFGDWGRFDKLRTGDVA